MSLIEKRTNPVLQHFGGEESGASIGDLPVLEEQHRGMVVAHHVVIGITQVQADGRVPSKDRRVGQLKARPADGVVSKGHAQQFRIGRERPVQFVSQTAGEQQLVVVIAEWKAFRRAGGAGVGAAAVENYLL